MKREELLKIAKPILFNTEMVKAILEGRKTVTRRIAKKLIAFDEEKELFNLCKNNGEWIGATSKEKIIKGYAPYQVGDILYIRETWQNGSFLEDNKGKTVGYIYKADDTKENNSYSDWGIKWRPSIHMPKEAARIFLKVTDVKVERLLEISEEQAIKEGFSDKFMFMAIWDDIYGNALRNPLVWAIEFGRVMA